MSRRNRGRIKVKKSRNHQKIIIISTIIITFLIFISVIFSLINIGNSKIIKNVYIGNIEVSGLSQEEAKEKIENILSNDIEIKYNEIEEKINIKDLEATTNVEELTKKAYKIGKTGNIVTDNYNILFTMIFKNKTDINIEFNNEKVEKEIEEINKKLPNAFEESNYYIEDENLIIKKGKAGTEVDKEKFIENIKQIAKKEENREITIPVKQTNPKEINIEDICSEIKKEPKNASIEQNPLKIYPHINGVDLAVTIEEAQKILEEEKEEYIIPLKITKPEITLDDLGKEVFPQILGTFSTTYNTSNQNRINNLELASKKINGAIILPGETFSYNKIVGERTIAKGYKEAAVYAGGKVVNGIGGGICQLSSTLYNAVLYANLEITSRSNHRFLTSYVTAGRDATVSWGTIDFCFKNTRSYPIKIMSEVKNGVVTTSIYGIKEEKEYEIEIESVVKEVLQYTTKYVEDLSLAEGEEQIVQYGANGAKSETYKIVKYNGAIISRTQISSDTYSPLEKIIKRGSKKEEEVIIMDGESQEKINPEILNQIKELN